MPTATALALREPAAVEFDVDRPWSRQPFDTERRWRAFVTYRELPPPRSIRRCSEALADPATGKPFDVRTLEQWSGENAWPERCLEYDRHLDAERVKATASILAEDARTTAAFHAELLRKLQLAAAAKAEQYLDRIATGDKLDEWTVADVRGIVKDCITLERLVRGQATERVDVNAGANLSALTLEEIEQLQRLYEKAGVVVE